jgi:hypothetical protein
MKLLALACLTLACATAGAQPAPPARKAPPPKGCVAHGTPVFEIDHRVDPGAKMPTSTFKIFESGAWTYESTDAEGKAGEPLRGCFAGDDLAAIKKDLESPWKITNAKFHCMAHSSAFTEYSVNGKIVFTQRICNGQSLDEASQKALTELEARAKTVTGA